jgi:hypothetical protein
VVFKRSALHGFRIRALFALQLLADFEITPLGIKDHHHPPLLQPTGKNVIEKVFGEAHRENQAGVEGRSVASSLRCLAKPT